MRKRTLTAAALSICAGAATLAGGALAQGVNRVRATAAG